MNQLKNSLRASILSTNTVVKPPYNAARAAIELIPYFAWKLARDRYVSQQNLTKLAGKYHEEKAVILCNGPSLLRSDLSSLNRCFTIGLNKINLLFDSSDFRPSAIVAVNKYVIQQNSSFFKSTRIPLFLEQKAARASGIHADKTKTLIFASGGYPGFSADPRFAVDSGPTVTHVALQIAYFLGFKYVALIGCDHSYEANGADHQLVVSGRTDPNHFDPRYFSEGMPWQLPSIAESEESYLRAKRFYEHDKRLIFNCTAGGKLELYPRISLEQFLAI